MKRIVFLFFLISIIILTACSVDVDNMDDNNELNEKNTQLNSDNISNKDQEINNEEKNRNNTSTNEHEKINDSDLAIHYNNLGYDLYKEGNYEEALNMFKKSFETDDNYYLGHYNYACTLGVLMKEDYPSWFASDAEIIEHLEKVIKLKPEYIEKIKSDPDLNLVRDQFDYYLLLGLSSENTEDVKALLTNLSWYVHGDGIFQVLGGIDFNEDGTFLLSYYHHDFFKDIGGKLTYLEYEGFYEVNENKVTLYLNEKMLRRRTKADIYDNGDVYEINLIITGELSKDGVLQFEIFEYPFLYWYDEFSA